MSLLKENLTGHTNPETCGHAAQQVNSTTPQNTTVELRILQDGQVYRSKAEMDRLIALGQWHHRRQRRRNRLRM